MIRDAFCASCAHRWITNQAPEPVEFCTPECADRWMDAHPDEKKRRNWITRADLVERIGGVVVPTKTLGGN